jgi:hypothetical protein
VTGFIEDFFLFDSGLEQIQKDSMKKAISQK